MCFANLIFPLSLLLSLLDFPTTRIAKIEKSANSAHSWSDTLKRPERTNATVTVLADSTIKNQQSGSSTSVGKSLIAGSDCRACHQLVNRAVGPSFTEIAQRYLNDKTAPVKLVNKIISGGRGVWGDQMMSAHPQLSKEDAMEMVNYILSVHG